MTRVVLGNGIAGKVVLWEAGNTVSGAHGVPKAQLGNEKKELDIPTLVIEADMNDARVYAEEQVHARIDAFMETLTNRT